MRQFFTGLLDKVFALVFAFLFCEIPQFMREYVLCLQGHVAESMRLIQSLEQSAALTQKDLSQYVQKFLSQTDPDFVSLGTLMQKLIDRNQELVHAMNSMASANLFSKPFVFLSTLQKDVFQETFQAFIPGISFNIETLVYAFLGLCFGTLFYRICRWFGSRFWGYLNRSSV